MTLSRVRLELARSAEFPHGSSAYGYEFIAPLDSDGRIDVDTWRTEKSRCTVHRFWRGEDDENGLLAHHRSGWAFDYDPNETDDDEPLFRFENHQFKKNEYISVTEHDGVQRTFQIVDVRAL